MLTSEVFSSALSLKGFIIVKVVIGWILTFLVPGHLRGNATRFVRCVSFFQILPAPSHRPTYFPWLIFGFFPPMESPLYSCLCSDFLEIMNAWKDDFR